MGRTTFNYHYRLCTLAVALAACNSGGGGTDTASGSTGPATSPGPTEAGEATHTEASAGATDSAASADGSASATDGQTSDLPTSSPTGDPLTSTSDPTGDPSTDPSTDPDTTATATSTTDANTTTPISGTTGTTTDGPPPANCGDGQIDGDELCDDGPDNGPEGACYADCTLNTCGDGVKSPLEGCDLGPGNGPDNGCSSECVVLPSACGDQAVMAELVPSPVDVVIIIDNSGSMTDEIVGVQNNINVNFAAILDNSGLDYRVILLARHGKSSSQSVCIEAPLSGIPQGGCAVPPAKPVNNPGKFYHYSREIASKDSWCRALATVNGAEDDDNKFAIDGWQTWLRPDSYKTFVELTDDRVGCTYDGKNFDDGNKIVNAGTAATNFDIALRAASPANFGATPETRNYRWYSLVGMPFNNPADKPYGPLDPVVIGKCPDGVNGGPGYQALSNLTGGTKFPLCNTASYDVVFQAIADGVIDSAKLSCEFDVPEAPEGKTLDKDTVTVVFTPMGMGNPVEFTKVDGLAQCAPGAFYLEGEKVILCPATCDSIQGDKDASVAVEFTCEPLVPK